MDDLSAATTRVLERLGARLNGEARLSKYDVEDTASVILALGMLVDGHERRLLEVGELLTQPLTLPQDFGDTSPQTEGL